MGFEHKSFTKEFGYGAVDLNVAFRIRYTGSQAAAHVSLAATTGDITFEQGATTAAAAVTTGTNPGTAGVINVSDASVDTLAKLVRVIDTAGSDWEAWLVDYPGDEASEISAGNSMFFGNLTDQDCTGDNGFASLVDTSLKTAEDYAVGVTWNGPSSKPHNEDMGMRHEILQIRANVTFAGATDGIYIYECDDRAGTKTQIGHYALTTATATNIPASGGVEEPIISVDGHRIVVMAKDSSGAITPAVMHVIARSTPIHPVVREKNLLSNY